MLAAGQNDPAGLAASLVPPGHAFRLVTGAPEGMHEALTSRGCVASDSPDAIVIGGPDHVGAASAVVVTATHDGHGSAAARQDGALGRLLASAASHGRGLLGRQHQFEGFTSADPALAADPTCWIRWVAILAGPENLRPPRPRPRTVPARSVLLAAHEPFNLWDETRRRAVLELAADLAQQETTLILSWDPRRLTGSLRAHVDLARAGIVLHGGDGVFDHDGDEPTFAAPSLAQLVATYAPDVVVVADEERAGAPLHEAANAAPRSTFLGLGISGGELETWTTIGRLRPDVLAALAAPLEPGTQQLGAVPVRDRQAGVTSVVIPVHGRWDLTEACLDSLAEHTSRPIEIVVVDNASPDGTREHLRQRPDVVLVESDVNLGFAGGTNLGLAKASGEFLCLLNNDTEVVSGWLDELHHALDMPGAGAVGPRCNHISGPQLIASAPRITDDGSRAWAREWAASRRGQHWLTSRLVGFCLLLRADTLETLGSLDEGVGVGNFEDDELCRRLLDAGLDLRVADGSLVLHHGSATFESAEIGYLTALRAGARHVGGGTRIAAGLTTARIVADGSAEDLRVATLLARMLADDLVVVAPDGDLVGAGLAAILADPPAVRITSADAPPLPTTTSWVLHLGAKDHLDPRDWGRDRAAIEALPRVVHTVAGMPGVVLEPIDGHVGPRPATSSGHAVTDAVRAREG